jgi:CHAT domain
MFTEYLDCRIEFQPRSGDAFPFSISAPGGETRGSLTLPTSDQDYAALAKKLEQLDVDEETLTQLGQKLFEALFQGSVKEVFVRSQGRLHDGQGLRIVLNTAASEQEVGALPWEFLYDPDQGPLTMLDTPIVRYLQLSASTPRLKTELPLKVLLTGATPRGQPPINVERELKEIVAALSELAQQGRVQITAVPNLTRSKLQQLLRQGFHIWHFAGHGGFKPDGKTGVLHFEDAQGDLEAVNALELGILLNRSVRLVVLDACQSGALQTAPFRSMAPALIRAQIPAVIAMQFKVLDEAARAFAGEFYRALVEGFPIDACVTEGRKAVMGAVGLSRADWGIPVVYTRAADGRLFDLPAAKAPDQEPKPMVQAVDIQAERIQALRDEIESKKRRLWALQRRAAQYGINAPPEVVTEIEDLEGRKDYRGNLIREGEIARLERQLKELGG